MTNIELIELTLSQIGRIAQIISRLESECHYAKVLIQKEKGEKYAETFTKLEMQHKEALNRCRLALQDVLEYIANYQDNIDATTNVDAALGKVAFDLIYERKTEDDFED